MDAIFNVLADDKSEFGQALWARIEADGEYLRTHESKIARNLATLGEVRLFCSKFGVSVILDNPKFSNIFYQNNQPIRGILSRTDKGYSVKIEILKVS